MTLQASKELSIWRHHHYVLIDKIAYNKYAYTIIILHKHRYFQVFAKETNSAICSQTLTYEPILSLLYCIYTM